MTFKSVALVLGLFAAAVSMTRAGEVSSFPFEFNDGLIWVKVAANGESLNFVLDSGAGASVLSLQATRRLQVKLHAPMAVQTVHGLTTGYQVRDFSGAAGGVPLKQKMIAMDLRGESDGCCRSIDGLIGQDFFRGRIVRIDFKAHRVSVLDRVNSSCRSSTLPLRYHGDALCVPVGINGGKPQWTRLDTGCSSSLEYAGNIEETKNQRSRSVAVGGQSQNSIPTDVQLGDEYVPAVRAGIHKVPLFSGEAGLLGSGLLSKYCVTIDAKNMHLFLERL